MAILSNDGSYVTVEKGDTLWGIAREYGNGKTYQQLAAINDISNPDLIAIGQKIMLKASSGGSPSSSATTSNKPIIQQFGLQSDANNTLFATWSWNKDKTESYKVLWTYDTGDDVWFTGNNGSNTVDKDSPETAKQSTYTIPSNAKKVRFKVKPISEKKTQNANDAIERMGHLQETAIMCDGSNLLEGKYDQIVNANYTVSANDLLVDELTNAVVKSLEYGNDRTRFTSHTGKIISVPNKTWLLLVNKEVEREKIKQAILSLTPYDAADAEYVSTYGGEIGNTYVEVDITTQEVFHYVNGIQCCYSPIVTGHAGRHDTPIGVYFVSERIAGKYLVGDTYRTWVDRWMRLTNSGIGLHDASWRGTFGGDIYQSNGSHGCINLPKNYTYSLYNEITVGTPVVIHN